MKMVRSWLMLLVMFALPACAQGPESPAATTTKAGRISGTVVHFVSGQPLAGIEVSIAPTEQRDLSVQAVTGVDGRFTFDHVVWGKYNLSANGRGFSMQAYQQHGQFSTAVAVGPGLDSENLIFQLVPDGSISGIVVDEENEAVRSGEVLLFSRGAAGPGRIALQTRGTLDEQGRYHFGHLQPGSYLVAIVAQPWYAQDPPGFTRPTQLSIDGEATTNPETAPAEPDAQASSPLDVTYRITYYADAIDPENATPILLHPGERATADVTLRTVPALHLTVRNVGGDPSQPATAILQQRAFDSLPVAIQARSQQFAAGVFKVSGVPPGHLILNLRTFTGKDWRSETKEVDVAADAEIDASENPGAITVKGVVRATPADASLPPGAYLRFFNRVTGETFGTKISPKGRFELQQAVSGPTNYEVAVFGLPDAAVQTIDATGAKVVGRTLLLSRSGSVQLTITMSKGFARINGTALRDDKPVSQTMVVLVPQNAEGNVDLFRRDQSDSDGTFSLYQVMPGRYTVLAIENGWDLDWQNPAVLKPYLEHGQPIEVMATRTYKVSVTAQDNPTQASTPPQP